MKISRVISVPFDAALIEPFEIAGGVQTAAENVLVTVILEDGTEGRGEAAPFPDFNGETRAGTLRALRSAGSFLAGRDIGRPNALARELALGLRRHGAARAGLEAALLDAWTRRRGVPLRAWFGGRADAVRTDATIPAAPPDRARRLAAKWRRFGIRTIKIKIGRNPEDDFRRVLAAKRGHPRAEILLDANGGFSAQDALAFLARLTRAGVRPALFEQPTPKSDVAGLRRVALKGGVPVAADESVSRAADVLRLARAGAVQVINVKLMKCGVFESLDIARTARACGMRLMIGGLVESGLAMSVSAHLASGFGGFDFVDLDTPLFFARDPMRWNGIRRGGFYRLDGARAGHGVTPKRPDSLLRVRYNKA